MMREAGARTTVGVGTVSILSQRSTVTRGMGNVVGTTEVVLLLCNEMPVTKVHTTHTATRHLIDNNDSMAIGEEHLSLLKEEEKNKFLQFFNLLVPE